MASTSAMEFRETPLLLPQEDAGQALREMSPQQMAQLLDVMEHVNRGIQLEQVMNELYEHVSHVIPCNRLGLALLDDTKHMAVSRWVKSDHAVVLGVGYQNPITHSSLERVVRARQMRVIHDLLVYAQEHPESRSTELLLKEGMRSSLTCPLVIREEVIGLLFFSSTRPHAYDDAAIRFYQHIAAQVSVVVEKARLYSELAEYTLAIERQNQNLHRQMELARQVQRTFIPEHPPQVAGLEMSLLYEPADEVGGDLIEFSPLEDGRLLLFMADAMGHGVPAALAMAAVKALLLSVIAQTREPSEVLRRLNESLPALLAQQFAAAAAILIDPEHKVLTVARAGFPPPVIVAGSTGECRPVSVGGMPLSLEVAQPYPAMQVSFEPGDLMVLATDGLTEAANQQGEEFGARRLEQVVRTYRTADASGCLREILAALEGFRGRASMKDDMSIVVVRHRSI